MVGDVYFQVPEYQEYELEIKRKKWSAQYAPGPSLNLFS
jgi:hypothetical protein